MSQQCFQAFLSFGAAAPQARLGLLRVLLHLDLVDLVVAVLPVVVVALALEPIRVVSADSVPRRPALLRTGLRFIRVGETIGAVVLLVAAVAVVLGITTLRILRIMEVPLITDLRITGRPTILHLQTGMKPLVRLLPRPLFLHTKSLVLLLLLLQRLQLL
jgi:hypothetical protein